MSRHWNHQPLLIKTVFKAFLLCTYQLLKTKEATLLTVVLSMWPWMCFRELLGGAQGVPCWHFLACLQSCSYALSSAGGGSPGILPCTRRRETCRSRFRGPKVPFCGCWTSGARTWISLGGPFSIHTKSCLDLLISSSVPSQIKHQLSVAPEAMHPQPIAEAPSFTAACASSLLPVGWSAGLYAPGRSLSVWGLAALTWDCWAARGSTQVSTSSRRIWGILVVMAQAPESKGHPGA